MFEPGNLAFGVFDSEFVYHSEEARRVGGVFNWTWGDKEVKEREVQGMTGEELSKRMDFPLVSVVLAYDGIQKTPKKLIDDLVGAFPEAGLLLSEFEKVDIRRSNSGRRQSRNRS